MKIFLLFATVCVSALAAVDFNQNEIVEGQLQNTFIQLQSSGLENDIDDQLLRAELQNIESSQGRNFVENSIKNLLEGFRDVIINGNEIVPPLDPLEIDHLGPFGYKLITGIYATANLRDIHFEGLRWYTVDRVKFNILRLTFGLQVTIPRVTLNGRYDSRARVLLATHNAAGNYRIFVNRLEFGVDARLGTNFLGGGHLVLRELAVKIDIHDTNFRVDGMTGSVLINSAISAFVQTVTSSVIQSQVENVSVMLSEELFDVINDFLKNYRLSDIIG